MDNFNFIIDHLMGIDESLATNDINTALKKTHECIAKVKELQNVDQLPECAIEQPEVAASN